MRSARGKGRTYLNNVQRLFYRRLGVKAQPSINFCRDLARNNFQDLLSELYEQCIKSRLDLLVKRSFDFFSFYNCGVDELCVLGLLSGGKNKGWVGGGILRLVLRDGGKVARVADNGL
jgi:hypothetical protein